MVGCLFLRRGFRALPLEGRATGTSNHHPSTGRERAAHGIVEPPAVRRRDAAVSAGSGSDAPGQEAA